MKYTIKDFSHLKNIGEISEKAMSMHLKLYEGYVNNTNLILEKLDFLKGQQNENPEYFAKFVPEYNELHRRLGWEWNGMRNHELFFEGLTPSPSPQERGESALPNFNTWKNEFVKYAVLAGRCWYKIKKLNNY